MLSAFLLMFVVYLVRAVMLDWSTFSMTERAALLGVASVMAAVLHFHIHWVRAEFDRASGRIEITRRGLIYRKREVYSLKALESVRIDQSSDSDGDSHRVVLVFSDRMLAELDPAERDRLVSRHKQGFRQVPPNEVPLTLYFSGISSPQDAALALNRWIARPD